MLNYNLFALIYTRIKLTTLYLSFYSQLVTCLGITAGGIGALIYALDSSVKAGDLAAHPARYKWDFYGMFNSLDHARYASAC